MDVIPEKRMQRRDLEGTAWCQKEVERGMGAVLQLTSFLIDPYEERSLVTSIFGS